MIRTRVAMVAAGGLAGQGGIGRVMAYLARELARTQPDIELVPYRSRWSESGLAKHVLAMPALAAFVIGVRRADVAHINVAPRGSTWRKMLFAGAARMAGVPVVLHLHGSGYHEFYAGLSAARQARIRRFFGRAAAVVVLSEFWRRFVIDTLDVAEDRVEEIPNGVPAAGRAPGSAEGEPPRIAFLGLIGERKGVDVLLDALANIKRRGIPWRAVLAGNGEVDWARQRATELGIADRIEFPGWIGEEEADAVLLAADLFVLPSRAENQPVSILEAMARGLPVIATRIGAIPEQVAEGETGLLVERGDADALADALAALLTAPDRRKALGAAGRERFERLFSVESCAARFAALYRAQAKGSSR